MNRILIAAFSVIPSLAALSACSGTEAKAPQTKAQQAARPALWKVVDPDTTVYLFGTIHMLPKGLTWTTPTMAKAMSESQGLVLEVALDKDPAKLGAIMTRLGVTAGLPPLLDRVPPAKRVALQKVIDESKVPIGYLNGLETWAAALVLSTASLSKLNLSHEDGVETQLTQTFSAVGKPVSGLETAEQQLGYFDGLPETAQRKFLASIADDTQNAQKEFAAMIAAWKAGDVRRIAITFDDEMKMSKDLTDVLLRRRNANWAGWIAERMNTPGTVFVAVGAGHLAGKGSVEELVSQKGYKVVRVQ